MTKKNEKDKNDSLFAWGELNPIFKNQIEQSYTDHDLITQNPISFAIKLARDANIKDARDGTGSFRGVVVRDEGTVSLRSLTINSPWIQAYNKSVIKHSKSINTADPLHSYKIYVPEIDLVKDPEPQKKLTKEKIKGKWQITGQKKIQHEKIDRCRTYISIKSDVPKAHLGQLVYVDFGNSTNLEDPIYLGPVYTKSNPPPEKLTQEAFDAFMKKSTAVPKPKPPKKTGYQRPQTGMENALHGKPCQGFWSSFFGNVPTGKWREIQGGIYTNSEVRIVECVEPEPTNSEKLARKTQLRQAVGYKQGDTLPEGWENMSDEELKESIKTKMKLSEATSPRPRRGYGGGKIL